MIKTLYTIPAIILTLDLFGFLAWIASGQHPEGFYIGKLTYTIINIFT